MVDEGMVQRQEERRTGYRDQPPTGYQVHQGHHREGRVAGGLLPQADGGAPCSPCPDARTGHQSNPSIHSITSWQIQRDKTSSPLRSSPLWTESVTSSSAVRPRKCSDSALPWAFLDHSRRRRSRPRLYSPRRRKEKTGVNRYSAQQPPERSSGGCYYSSAALAFFI